MVNKKLEKQDAEFQFSLFPGLFKLSLSCHSFFRKIDLLVLWEEVFYLWLSWDLSWWCVHQPPPYPSPPPLTQQKKQDWDQCLPQILVNRGTVKENFMFIPCLTSPCFNREVLSWLSKCNREGQGWRRRKRRISFLKWFVLTRMVYVESYWQSSVSWWCNLDFHPSHTGHIDLYLKRC